MTTEEKNKLIEEAKIRYPIGTIFKSATSNKIFTIKSHDASNSTNNIVFETLELNNTKENYGAVYSTWQQKWAEIVSKPEIKQSYNYVKSVKDNDRFKKGQLIQTFRQSDKEHFYYTLDKCFSLSGKDYSFIPCTKDGNPIKGYSTSDLIIEDDKPSKFNIGDIINTDDTGYQYANMLSNSKNSLFNWDRIKQCNVETSVENNLKVLNKVYSKYTKSWWYKVDNYGNWISENCMSLANKFEVGKWYKWLWKVDEKIIYGKFKSSGTTAFLAEEGVHDNSYDKINGYFYKDCENIQLLTDLSEIQQYLPDGHPDKVTTASEYVECIIDTWSNNNKNLGKMFKIENSKTGKYIPGYCIEGSKSWNNNFKPSTKEAYDMQNKPKSLVGRYLKRLSYCIASCKIGDYLQILEDFNTYLILNKYGRLEKNDMNHWELMPEGFEPNKVEEEWIPKIGDWVTVKKDADCFGNDAYNIKGKAFQITQEVTKKGFYGLYCIGYANQFPGVFSLSEGGIYIKYLRPALPHEIPCFSGIDPIKSDDFVLPEKWCIKSNKLIYPILKKWANFNWWGDNFNRYIHHNKTWSNDLSDDYTEITFEQFKKYVLKEDIMSIINHECKVNIDENRSFNTFKQVSHLLTEMVKPYKETSLIQQSLKTELELIPIKKLKTFNN